MSDKAFQLGDNELAAYIFNHYNWKFDFLRLTVQEIVDEYLRAVSYTHLTLPTIALV